MEDDPVKLRKLLPRLAFALVLTMALATGAHAASVWKTCTINKIGVNAGSYFVQVNDTATTPAFMFRWIEFNDADKQAKLAVILTAMANNKKVYMNIEDSNWTLKWISVLN